jgi:hypothetical protein
LSLFLTYRKGESEIKICKHGSLKPAVESTHLLVPINNLPFADTLALPPTKLKKTTNEYFGIHIAFFFKISLEKIMEI